MIPRACRAIGANAFDGASRLEYMVMPAESFIDPEAFSGPDAAIIMRS